jgi:hypothetical protein
MTWSDITSKVSGTSVTWDGLTLSGNTTIRLEVRDAAGNSINSTTETTISTAGATTTTTTIIPVATDVVSFPLVAGISNEVILGVDLPQGVSFIVKEISGSAITGLSQQISASVAAVTTNNAAFQNGIDAYVSALADPQHVAVRTISFSSGVIIPPDQLVVKGSAGHQEALIIDTTGLPAGSQLDLQNVEFAIIVGDNVTIRGGLGANIVYAGSGHQDIVLGLDDDILHGGDGNDYVGSLGGNDQLYGDAGNDTLSGGTDNDTLDGGTGDDTAMFSGNFADYTISYDTVTEKYLLVDHTAGRDGTDIVTNIEYFRFVDVTTTSSFIVSDIIAPIVTIITPDDADVGVGVGSDITLTFSEAIQFGIGIIAIHSGSTDSVALDAHITISGNILTINPASDLEQSTHYFVTISDGSITDQAGNKYAGSSSYDFTTGTDMPDHHALGGNITFWKTGEAISDVTTTLSAMPIVGTQLVEFRDIHTNANGSHTVEIWATSSSDIASLQLEFMLSTVSAASWNSGDGLPADWMSAVNTATGQFQLASITGATALPAGTLKLGTLTVTSSTSAGHVELLLNSGTLGNEAVATTGIVFDSTTTGSDGSYHYIDVQDGLYSLMAERASGTFDHSAITAADALAALKMAVGLNPNADSVAVSPYQYLAADVNHDGKIRSTDALNILKMAVGLETAPHDEWIFVPESVGSETMTRNHVDWSEAAVALDLYENMEFDLVGIVKGDVNGSWGA